MHVGTFLVFQEQEKGEERYKLAGWSNANAFGITGYLWLVIVGVYGIDDPMQSRI